MVRKYKNSKGGQEILASYDRLVAAWGIPVSEKDLPTPYGTTHVLLAGAPEKPPLLLFHGVGDDSALMWLINAKPLAEHFHLFAVDTIGGPGKSEPNEAYFNHFDQVVWIDSILDALHLPQVNVAGVSNGAYLTQLYTAKRPERVRKAVCMAGGLAVQGQKSPIWRMMKVFLPEALFPTEKNARKLMCKLCANPDALFRHEELMRHWLLLLKYFNNASMMQHKVTGFNDAEIDGIRDRTRFLIGSGDRLGNAAGSTDLLDRYRMNYRLVEQAGHALNHEQPALVEAEIIRHLTAD